jgi:hypothetical protein
MQQLGQLDAQQYEYVGLLIYSNANVASTKLFLWSCRKTHLEMKVLAVFFLYRPNFFSLHSEACFMLKTLDFGLTSSLDIIFEIKCML